MKVLIADDERDTLMTLGILLRSEGFDVQLAVSGAEVPKMVREFRPDVVLLDLGMQDRNGYEIAMELTSEHGEACPILIAITAYSNDSYRRLSQQLGFRHHVAKPYDPNGLLRLLASLDSGGGLRPTA